MNKRDYLRSLGFTVGQRGRFTPEMLTALANANMEFDNTPQVKGEVISVEETPLAYPEIKSERVREPRSLYGFTREGHKVGFVLCFSCSQHMMYCKCAKGVTAPSIVAYTKEDCVYIPEHQRINEHSQQLV